VQSPNPVEILSKKSPEKLLLPHPTDLDLDTFLSKVEAEAVAWLLGLSSSSSTTTILSPFFDKEEPKHFSFGLTMDPFVVAAAAGGGCVVAAKEDIFSVFLVEVLDLEEER
jgi:hypothetical protein